MSAFECASCKEGAAKAFATSIGESVTFLPGFHQPRRRPNTLNEAKTVMATAIAR